MLRLQRLSQLTAAFFLSLTAAFLLTGCGASPQISGGATSPLLSVAGKVKGGQQPVSGSKVYLYAVSTTANAGAATSLIPGQGYVLTGSDGSFNIPGANTCTLGDYVYLLALGGNPGLNGNATNPDLAMAAGLGLCDTLPSTSFAINEVTTVAAAYSLAGFATSETQIGSTSPAVLSHAFTNLGNLIDIPSGTALTLTPTGNGVVPQATINALANVLAACVNSDGTGPGCSLLMSNSNVSSGGATPVDTFQAVLNIAHNPTVNVSGIFNSASSNQVFTPALIAAPSDWTIVIQYPGSVTPPPAVVVALTPGAATIGQGDTATFAASVTGSSAGSFSYNWTTTATAGTLSEVGGAARTGMTTLCTTNPQIVYVPNASLVLTDTASDTVQVQVFSGSGCSTASLIASQTATVGTVLPVAQTTVPGLTTAVLSATIMLPPGTSLTPDQLTVLNGITQTNPLPSGLFSIPAYTTGSQIAIVESPAGNPMLMGWLDANHPVVSASTTAEVFAYYALGGPFMLNPADRATLIADIVAAPGLPAFAQVVASEIVANPDALAGHNANLTTALNVFFTSVSGFTSSTFAKLGGPKAQSVNVTGGSQSGLDVQPVSIAQYDVVNSYRRLTHAFVQRISETPLGTGALPVSTPGPFTEFDVSQTGGLNAGFIGAVTSIFNAYFGNSPTAYAPVTTGPFDAPLDSGFAKTTYRVTIVGPGTGRAGFLSTLSNTIQDAQVDVSLRGFIGDVLTPIATNILFGSDPESPFIAGFERNLQNDVIGAIGSTSALKDKISSGDIAGAAQDIVFNGVNGQTFATLVGEGVKATITAAGHAAGYSSVTLADGLKSFNKALTAVNVGLEALDASIYIIQVLGSDRVDQWTIDSVATAVTLTPAASSLGQLSKTTQEVVLTALVPGADTTGYSYLWTNTQLAGMLSPGSGASSTPISATSYCSAANIAEYIPNSTPLLSVSVTDSSTVQAFSAAGCTKAHLLGTAPAATIMVNPTGVALSPALSTIAQSSGTVPLAVAVFGDDGTPSTLAFAYQWMLTGTAGAAPVGVLNEGGGGTQTGTSFCSTHATATYMPNAAPLLSSNTTDQVVVQVFNGGTCPPGNNASVGKSGAASITVTDVSLLITPHNPTIAQTVNQSLSVTPSGAGAVGSSAVPLFYQWNLIGGSSTTPGTLIEAGGTGQTGSGFCSPSTQVTYVPSPTPVLTAPVTDILQVQAFTANTCAPATLTSGQVSTLITVNAAPTATDLPLAVAVSGVMQASDGNFYGAAAYTALNSCYNGSTTATDCGSIYQITPDGTQSLIYTFPLSLSITANPSPLIEGPDGNLYGLSRTGSSQNANLFKLTFNGAFSSVNLGISLSTNALSLGSDGHFYVWGATANPNPPYVGLDTIFQIAPDGTVLASCIPANATCAFPGIAGLIQQHSGSAQGPDGSQFALGTSPDPNSVAVTVTETYPGGGVSILDSFNDVRLTVVSGGGYCYIPGVYFATTPAPPCPPGFSYGGGGASISYSQIYGYVPLKFGSDQKLYTTRYSGTYYSTNSSFYSVTPLDSACQYSNQFTYTQILSETGTGANCTSLIQIGLVGTSQVLHDYTAGADGNFLFAPLSYGQNQFYFGGAGGSGTTTPAIVQDSKGRLINSLRTLGPTSSATLNGSISLVDDHLPPPIQLSFLDNTGKPVSIIRAGSPVTVQWQVLNGFSASAQVCYAFLQNGATTTDAGNWTGPQLGVYTQPIYAGSTVIMPATPGIYTYALTCGGIQSGFATLGVL